MAGIPSVVTTTTVATSGTGTTATVQLNRAPMVAVGTKVLISGVDPVAYNGEFTVTARSNTSPYSVSFASTATGSMNRAGTFALAPTVTAQGGGVKSYTNTANTTAATTETYTLTQAGAATAIQKYYATLTLDAPLNVAIGSTISVSSSMVPAGYRTTALGVTPAVTGVVTGVSDTYPYSVSYEVNGVLGAQTAAGVVTVTGTQFDSGDYGTVGKTANLMAGNNQDSVMGFYQNQQDAGLEAKKSDLFIGLNPNLPFPLALLEKAAQMFLRGGYDLVLGVVTTAAQAATAIGQIVAKVVDWIGEAISEAGKIVGDITTALVDAAGNAVQDFLDMLHWVFTGGPAGEFAKLTSGHKSLDDVSTKAKELKTTVYLTDIESGTTSDFFNTVRVLPSWVGGKNDDVNLPHSFIAGTSTTVATSPSTLGLDGRLVLIPVVAGQNRTWSAVKFGVSQMASGAKVPGYQYFYGTLTSASTATVGATKVATIGLPTPSYVDVGEQITVAGFPTSWAGYNGTWTVSAKSDVVPYSVSYVVPALLPTATPTTPTYTIAATATSGTGTTATVTTSSFLGAAVGETILVSGITPTAYNGQFTVTSRTTASPYRVSYSSTATGSMTVAGSVGTDPVLTTATPPSYVAPSVTAPSAFLMGVYDVDETTGAATKVIDLGNVRSKINVGDNAQRNLQVISLPSPKTVQMGEIYYIGILQIGADVALTPAGSIALSYAPSSVIPYTFNTGQFPKRVCLYHNAGTFGVLPATFTDSQLSGSSSSFWGAFGDASPSTVAPTVTFADSFTTGTNGIGAGATIDSQKWLTRYGSGLKVASMPGSELRATADSTTGTSMHTYRFKTNYLKQNNQCTFATQTENIGRLGRGGIMLSLRGDGLGKFIYLRLVIETAFLSWQIRAGIYTSTSFTAVGSEFSGGVLRKEVITNTGLGPANGNTWKFVADGYSYVGYRNTGSGFTEHIRWDDTGFAFAGSGPSNSNFKEVGIGAYYVAEYSCVDNWTAWDASS